MAKQLRIGMIGYGFMGRAHSNGYNRVKDFFDLEYLPVLQAAFHTVALSAFDWLVATVVSAMLLVLMELFKVGVRARR